MKHTKGDWESLTAGQAVITIAEASQLFDKNERTIRRWVEDGMPRRTDGKFVLHLAFWWWLTFNRRQFSRHANPDMDLISLVLNLLRMHGLHKYKEEMLCLAEHFLVVPTLHKDFCNFRDLLRQDATKQKN